MTRWSRLKVSLTRSTMIEDIRHGERRERRDPPQVELLPIAESVRFGSAEMEP